MDVTPGKPRNRAIGTAEPGRRCAMDWNARSSAKASHMDQVIEYKGIKELARALR